MTNQEWIGKLLNDEATRDAVHIAVLPVISHQTYIYPGELVKLVFGTTNRVIRTSVNDTQSIGVADPFLKEPAAEGERFFVFIHPNTISGMRHIWTHPQIDNVQPPANASELWLRQFADRWNFDYNQLISGAQIGEGEYAVAGGQDLHGAGGLGADHDLFWSHLENLTGKKFDVQHRQAFGWSCSC